MVRRRILDSHEFSGEWRVRQRIQHDDVNVRLLVQLEHVEATGRRGRNGNAGMPREGQYAKKENGAARPDGAFHPDAKIEKSGWHEKDAKRPPNRAAIDLERAYPELPGKRNAENDEDGEHEPRGADASPPHQQQREQQAKPGEPGSIEHEHIGEYAGAGFPESERKRVGHEVELQEDEEKYSVPGFRGYGGTNEPYQIDPHSGVSCLIFGIRRSSSWSPPNHGPSRSRRAR